jgi:DNA-binding NtrC family response regulator
MDIEALVKDGRFRQDLLYRLNAFELLVPPLRQRGEDCRALAEHFCSRIATTEHIAAYLTEDAFAALAHYDWPGNVRELKNVVERTVVIRGAGAITAQDLDLGSHRSGAHRSGAHRAHAVLGESDDEKPFQTLAELESEHIRDALTRCQGNRTQAARLLGVARSTLLRKLEPKS